jgi:CheY-like chemotaxis protein
MEVRPLTASSSVKACRRVLIVDESDESRDVLRTVLERRGVQIIEASRVHQGLELAQSHRPDLIVLDVEAIPDDEASVYDDFDARSRAGASSLVVLGSTSRPGAPRSDGRFIAKPYHYATLVRKIEELLDQSALD